MSTPGERKRAVRRAREPAEDALRALADRPDELRDVALRLVREVGEGSASLWYELGMVDGDPYPVRWKSHPLGDEVPLERHLRERLPWPTVDPRVPPNGWNARFVLLPIAIEAERDVMRASKVYERVWRPAGIEDQLRMTVYQDGHHVAWIGAIRRRGEPPFARADQRRLARISDALADALVTARRVEREGDEGCDLLVDTTGRVHFASEAGRRWLSRPDARRALRAWVRAVDRGEPAERVLDGRLVRWSRMGGGGRVRYLVQLDRIAPLRVHPGFALSTSQWDVAQLAAAGATSAEIAQMRGVAVETARAQLKQVYDLLGVATRAELGALFVHLTPHVEHRTLADLRRRARRP